jgi:hypothetical protein
MLTSDLVFVLFAFMAHKHILGHIVTKQESFWISLGYNKLEATLANHLT